MNVLTTNSFRTPQLNRPAAPSATKDQSSVQSDWGGGGDGNKFDAFVRNTSRAGSTATQFMFPLTVGLVTSRIAGNVAGAFLGPVGQLVGGFGGFYLGHRVGQQKAGDFSNFVDKLAGEKSAGREALVKTLSTAALGAATLGTLGGFSPQMAGIGAGLGVVGVAGYGAYKAFKE